MEVNELNKNANGGTELMGRRLQSLFPEDYLSKFQIIFSRVRDIDPDRKTILYLHDLAGDPEVQHLKDGGWENYDKLVFVSHWQQQMYNAYLGVPYEAGVVIENAIEPLPERGAKADSIIRLIYTSTPHRGLQILLPVYQALKAHFRNRNITIELDVFSSFNLYGWPQRDEQFKELFKALEEEDGITYHGAKSNDEVRHALLEADIFAYPSIWQETSCLCLIEAMSAGLTCVHSSLAALPETSLKQTMMYSFQEDHNKHANIFANTLAGAIDRHHQDNAACERLGNYQKAITDTTYNLDVYKARWQQLLETV